MQNSMKVALVVRKGAWTDEEDALLRKCIGRHGEGKWHLVPIRAGLNRCRKSCRMRWLNYLKPNRKRGEFEEDEVDLIIRLHKLLGNRWSLIAGRIPGRTANDVKNYWNTRFGKKTKSKEEKSREKSQEIIKVEVIKPRARTFTKASAWLCGKATLITSAAPQLDNNSENLEEKHMSLPPETEAVWWEGFSDNMDDLNMVSTQVCELLGKTTKTVEEAGIKDNEWDDISFDIDLWQL